MGGYPRLYAFPALRRARLLLPCALMLSCLLSGCALGTAADPVPTPVVAPTATPTVEVGFAVAVTAQPTRPPHRIHARPTPTRFVAPRRAYVLLLPASGPPASTTITIRGGHLPKSVRLDLVWGPKGRPSPLRTEAATNRDGQFSLQFSMPASQPGQYVIEVQQDGLILASALYTVESLAVMNVAADLNRTGDVLTVSGQHFLPSTRLYLVVYPTLRGHKPVPIGTVWSDKHGRMSYSYSTRKLSPGEYVLRAYSMSAITAQMAQTFFQVVL